MSAPTIQKLDDVIQQLFKGEINEEHIEFHYGNETLSVVKDKLQEIYFGLAEVPQLSTISPVSVS